MDSKYVEVFYLEKLYMINILGFTYQDLLIMPVHVRKNFIKLKNNLKNKSQEPVGEVSVSQVDKFFKEKYNVTPQ